MKQNKNIIFIEDHEDMRQRKIINKSMSLSGIIPSKKNENGIWFESALERDFALLLENNPDVSFYQDQPVTIEYVFNGKNRIYTPDFSVFFDEKLEIKPWLCEIKYRSKLREDFSILKPKFIAARNWCKDQGWEFKLFTEDYIRTQYLYNVNFLSRYDYLGLDGACYKLIIQTLSDLGHSTPNEVMLTMREAQFNVRGRCLYALWYGIKTGSIGCDIVNEKVSMKSEIWLKENLF